MVSRQIIVKATLSVALVLSCGACASAMYDPYVGHFASRDPIKYCSRSPNLQGFLFGKPLSTLDPSGLKCTIWVPITHGPRGAYVPDFEETCRDIWQMGPEYDKCDKIAPVCCWLEDGKKKCKYHYGKNVLPKDWPDWPGLIDTTTPGGESKIEQIFKFYLPKAMRGCCFQNTNRENDGEKLCKCEECKAVFVCHKTLVKYLNEFIDPTDPRMPQSNPCGKSWTYDCKTKSWTDKEGKLPEVKNVPEE